jgi:DNA-binding Lrp family transcriptional regulator
VKEAHALFGDIDGIALIEAQTPKLLTAIVQQISSVPGIERTDTRIVVP